MKHEDLKGKRVTVFGLGVNEGGVGTVEFLERAGVHEIIVTDRKTCEELAPSLSRLDRYENITYVLGRHRPEDFSRTDLVVKNPAIPWTNKYVQLAESEGIPVEMDSGIFFENCRNTIIGVTGTKGKTTTSGLIAHILRESGRQVVPVGVSREPVLGALEGLNPDDTVVFELSSWRLSALGRIQMSPHIAVFTNFFPDHLNYYGSVEAYRNDKRFLYAFQHEGDVLIAEAGLDFIRKDDPSSEKILYSALGDKVSSDGAFFRGEEAVVVRNGTETVLFRTSDIRIPGEHIRQDALAASVAAFVSGISGSEIATALRTFRGMPHRLELVAEGRGVSYYNDSAATVPESAVSALRSFDRPVVIIAGGSDKGLDFGPLAEEILRRAKAAIFLKGEGTDKLFAEIRKRPYGTEFLEGSESVSGMGEAVEKSVLVSEPGDIVLLSPGAASFGMFRNEFDRGERFREAVERLAT
ncbi:MAG TPA: UDP-N-acetylmuramoyl-L-alanine--D-glutamate ligase [Candidatus Fimivivens sp.]|nr:UDP-N-acetylmuramoyl-L-alanine--D-glutamate ligase [Candidatus Fimivivens sp.]